MTRKEHFAIHTRDLRKAFGKKIAVRGLSLAVERGEVFGFLGPNGAGKSTSIKMLLDLVRPSGGEAMVLGRPVGDVEARRKIGFLPEDFSFYDWLTPPELLRLHGSLCGVSSSHLEKRIPELIDTVGLTPHADKRLQEFSKGMLQRIGLAQALIHEPELIFLDEPTSGLDPMGRRLVRDIIRAQRERGVTIFLNSHLLSEIEITCDRVVFIREGEVVTSRDLRAGNDSELRVIVRARAFEKASTAKLAELSSSVVIDGEEMALVVRSAETLPAILRFLVESGVEVYEFTPRRLSLEELFVNIMGEDRGL